MARRQRDDADVRAATLEEEARQDPYPARCLSPEPAHVRPDGVEQLSLISLRQSGRRQLLP